MFLRVIIVFGLIAVPTGLEIDRAQAASVSNSDTVLIARKRRSRRSTRRAKRKAKRNYKKKLKMTKPSRLSKPRRRHRRYPASTVPAWLTGGKKWFCPASAAGTAGFEFMIMKGPKGMMCKGKHIGMLNGAAVNGTFSTLGKSAKCRTHNGKKVLRFKMDRSKRQMTTLKGVRCRLRR